MAKKTKEDKKAEEAIAAAFKKKGEAEERKANTNSLMLMLKLALDFNSSIIGLAALYAGKDLSKEAFKQVAEEYNYHAKKYQKGIDEVMERLTL